ncbi:MAG TPA: amidohydrolase [Armatimonadota bacterium]|nr:amidohydrolase [Armatimonadota bacterium]HPT98898.1 amidohydrolase [Armatimonadota bacterium]
MGDGKGAIVEPEITLSPEVQEVLADVIAIRREIHAHPELGYQEVRTAALVAERLQAMGLSVQTGVAETGVVGLLEGGQPGPVVMLRADMDALPIQELTGYPYASQVPGVMHACGHDGHTAALLGAAQVLSAMREQLAGSVKFVFQPAEESRAGAERMVQEGVLQAPRVDAAFGLHLWNSMSLGTVGVTTGPAMAATDYFEIIIRGRGGHAASPHQAVDPVLAAAHFLVTVQSIISRSRDPLAPAVFSIGCIRGGDAGNVIPDEVLLRGTLRTLSQENRTLLLKRIEEVLHGTTQALGATYDYDHRPGYPVLVNDAAMADLAREVAAAVVGKEGVLSPEPTMGGEDMAYYLQEVPGCYLWVGSANPSEEAYPHHNARFNMDERAIGIAVEILVRLARRYLA